jgi:4-amino-4-deoxy-L-arabinose transferase-like glycosyltransferase
LVATALVFAGAVRLRLLNVSFERDEGEYAYLGQLILQGIPPYELLYTMKLPGTGAVYALGMAVFGQSVSAVHLTLLIANGLTIVFVFLLGRRLAGSFGGAVAAISYAIMSLSPAVVGLAAHATHFVVLFAVPATWLLLRAVEDRRRGALFASGLLFGLAFLMKQQGLCFGGFALLYLAWKAWRTGDFFSRKFIWRMLVFGSGLFIPLAVTCLVLAGAGVFKQFWFWTFSYARFYESTLTIRDGLQFHLFDHLKQTRDLSIGLWVLVLAGLLAGWRVKALRPALLFAVAFWFFSFAGTAAGLYFRGHYFILLLPAFALLVGLAVAALRQIMPQRIFPDVFRSLPVIALGAVWAWMIYYQAPLFFQWPANLVCRQLYRDNPFVEAVAAAGQIRAHSLNTARVAVIGSEPEIYFYAQRHSATGYVYIYPLMEAQPYALVMQREMAREIESARPEFLVQVPYQLSWLRQPASSPFLADWFEDYAGKFYQKAGVVGFSSSGTLTSLWGAAATATNGLTSQCLTIYRRRSDADSGAGK